MRKSRLPLGGENKFQKIKAIIVKRRESGGDIINMSIGQPYGSAALMARMACASAVMSDEQGMHEYQDNSLIPPHLADFANIFVSRHIGSESGIFYGIDFCPIPGIKPVISNVISACIPKGETITVGVVSGYPTYADKCEELKGVEHYVIELNSENDFRVSPGDIREGTDLLILNYPHNPSGQIANGDFWAELCQHCEAHDIRLVNDAAYSLLSWGESSTLSDWAITRPNLSWLEMFSASKVTNFTGWRVGAVVGSEDFVGNFKTKKGNSDSGLCAFAAAGVLQVFNTSEGESVIQDNLLLYKARSEFLVNVLESYGMQLAVKPQGTFFVLFKVPQMAFGQDVNGDAERFNEVMINETGVVGVPFGKYIRYCVTLDVLQEEIGEKIKEAFEKAQVSY